MRASFLAAGFGLALGPPALLMVAAAYDTPWLPAVVLLVVMPLTRILFGDAPPEWPQWTERTASMLHALPVLVAVAHLSATLVVISSPSFMNLTASDAIAWVMSLWAVWLFASCASHEVLHAGRPWNRVGQMLAGMIGHPLQEHEHRVHHSRAGSEDLHEAPRIGSSVWAFSWARLRILPGNAWASNAAAQARTGSRGLGDLGWSLSALAATATAFGFAGGLTGLAVYLAVAFLTCWALQAMQYLQHWGLGQESIGQREEPVAWEDRCLIQAWLTLCTTYHQAHHTRSRTPFYRLVPVETAPRMPGGYVVLLIASLVPPAWRWLMLPALDQWRSDAANQRSAGRTLVCFKRPTQN